VAVHGIAGDAHNTWTHENGQFWLRDFIPKFLPDARVISWGYNIDTIEPLTNASLENLVGSFLIGLKIVGRNVEVSS
jgi:hypothetical protein